VFRGGRRDGRDGRDQRDRSGGWGGLDFVRSFGREGDADTFIDDVDDDFVELVSIWQGKWLVSSGARCRAGLDFRIREIAAGALSELGSGGFGELGEFGSAFSDEFFRWTGLELEQGAPGLGGQKDGVGFAELGRIFRFANELKGGIGMDLRQLRLLPVADPRLVAALFPAGNVLSEEAGVSEFGELIDDGGVFLGIIEHAVDGDAGVQGKTRHFAGAGMLTRRFKVQSSRFKVVDRAGGLVISRRV